MGKILVNNLEETVVLSSAVVCEVFGVSRQALSDWERAGLKKCSRGQWELKELIHFRGLGSAGGPDGKEKSLSEQKLIAEIALKESQGELSRLKNDIIAGKYLEEYYVVSELKRFFTVLKRSCMNLSRQISGQVAAHVPPAVAREIEHEIHGTIINALEQMSIGGVYSAKGAKARKKQQ